MSFPRSQSRTERGGGSNDSRGTEVPLGGDGGNELARPRNRDEGVGGGGGGTEGDIASAIKFWPKAKIVLKALTVTTTTNSAVGPPTGEKIT